MRSVVVLRPEPGNAATMERARALGLQAETHPLFAIEPCEWEMPTGKFDGLLLTSANAVRCVRRLPNLPVYAVGGATAGAARQAGSNVVATGETGVEDLVATLPASLSLLHLAGEDRIPLDHAPQAIVAVPVYRAVPLLPPSGRQLEGRVLLIHSPRAGRRIAAITLDRAATRIAAISPAAADACGPGWERCEAAATPNEAALLSLAAELCKD